ncbi:MAG TPA: hypothetical protein PLL64_09365 [Rhodothermales bacterium]|nr:hypothetical protein [Rhodothermales bacterium]HRR07427.1 hypothetical protein [Rhodothermales bacterium]
MLFIYSERSNFRLPEKRPFSIWLMLGYGLVGLLNGGIIGVFFTTYLAGLDPRLQVKTAQLIILYFSVLGLGLGVLTYTLVHLYGHRIGYNPPNTLHHPPEWDLRNY